MFLRFFIKILIALSLLDCSQLSTKPPKSFVNRTFSLNDSKSLSNVFFVELIKLILLSSIQFDMFNGFHNIFFITTSFNLYNSFLNPSEYVIKLLHPIDSFFIDFNIYRSEEHASELQSRP